MVKLHREDPQTTKRPAGVGTGTGRGQLRQHETADHAQQDSVLEPSRNVPVVAETDVLIVETPAGRQAIRARAVIDVAADAAVAAQTGAPIEHGQYFISLVHRYGGVDTDRAIRFGADPGDAPPAVAAEPVTAGVDLGAER